MQLQMQFINFAVVLAKSLSVDFNGSASHICFFALFAKTLVTRPHPDKLSMREDGELKIIDTWVLTKSKS